jgi:hypothetical protein
MGTCPSSILQEWVMVIHVILKLSCKSQTLPTQPFSPFFLMLLKE